ncbi:hypothetical protein [Candidatus Enterovibrio altilux]|uniref:hypothetical protein n=1 Tax=Candidatus Enterovibrio altilux TaxID=1927128 RepID=UPI0013747986|nr:hypothetical protein [Candidatus Enterovibrio luxaltus]
MKIKFHDLANKTGYYKHSLTETALILIKKLLRGTLSLRNDTTQISETDAWIKVFNKLT